ncbi:uncharacterized protein LOC114937702 [Nylanderia fulva]|uniref:uncharacterized protein LOC114937702 n=1 Tax=Nylanderia fulva TaxID=613905 RepID=UPI0010FB7054|nr:uncharacterized protein LOC114937702 [Nylanderia fulva]
MKTFQAPLAGKYSSLQKNFGLHMGQQISSAKLATEGQQISFVKMATEGQQISPVKMATEGQQIFSAKMATIKQFPVAKSCSAQNIRNFNTFNEKENDKNNTNVNINADLLIKTQSQVHSSDISETNSVSELSTSAAVQKKDLLSKRKVKGKQPDVLHNAICKVTFLLENKYSTSSQSTLKPEVEEDVAFCQLILSTLINMPPNTKNR